MSVLFDNPVLTRELRSRLRLRKLQTSKPLAVLIGVVLLVIAWFYGKGLIAIGHSEPADARELLGFLLMFLVLLIVVITPALLSTAITREREQQTWETLATTRLSGAQVLLGKWLGRLTMTLLPILILLPFLLACVVKASLSPLDFVALLLFLLITAAGYAMLGLLCSFLVKKSVSATVTALAVPLAICIGTPLIGTVMAGFTVADSPNYTYQDPSIYWINPFYALMALETAIDPNHQGAFNNVTGPAGTAAFVYLLLTSLATILGLYFMVSRYRSAARE